MHSEETKVDAASEARDGELLFGDRWSWFFDDSLNFIKTIRLR